MRRSVFSPSWHKVATLRPRLLPNARLFSHVYRGQHWYVVQDNTSGRHHRLSPSAYRFAIHMDGLHTVQELWDETCRHAGPDLPTQEEIVDLLIQLHTHDLLHCATITPDAVELFERYRKHRRRKWQQWLLNPMSLRFPLYNPDALLTRLARHLSWLTTRWGVALWMIIVIPAIVLAGVHWRELTENITDQVLTTQNLLIMAVLFPIIKILHEVGHGLTTKIWGGPVHEMGVMFLVFAPLPYVDASAAATFRSKRRRIAVGAAGMLVEVFLAALAMYAWVLMEPGLPRAIAFNTMLIAGISTVLVNGNPLLRFDGYYILADLIEIPNLGQRGNRYLTYLCDRYLFGAREIDPSPETNAEKRWLAPYTVISWIYRLAIMISIAIFVASEFFFIGVILAIWSLATLLLVPLGKGLKHLLEGPSLQRHRARAFSVTLCIIAAIALLIGWVKLPLRTQAEGVVWLPEQALVRAGADGFFQQWLVPPGTYVQPGTPLFVMSNALLATERKIAQARVAEAAARYRVAQFSDQVQAQITQQQLVQAQRTLAQLDERHERLIVRSAVSGILTVPTPQDMREKFFKQGELLGYLLEQQQLIARIVVTQQNIDLVRTRLTATQLRFAATLHTTHPVTVMREVPGGVDELPNPALGPTGGGTIAVDPSDPQGLKTLERVFLYDIRLPENTPLQTFGSHVYVRFEHGQEAVFTQVYRRARQLFLSQFQV